MNNLLTISIGTGGTICAFYFYKYFQKKYTILNNVLEYHNRDIELFISIVKKMKEELKEANLNIKIISNNQRNSTYTIEKQCMQILQLEEKISKLKKKVRIKATPEIMSSSMILTPPNKMHESHYFSDVESDCHSN